MPILTAASVFVGLLLPGRASGFEGWAQDRPLVAHTLTPTPLNEHPQKFPLFSELARHSTYLPAGESSLDHQAAPPHLHHMRHRARPPKQPFCFCLAQNKTLVLCNIVTQHRSAQNKHSGFELNPLREQRSRRDPVTGSLISLGRDPLLGRVPTVFISLLG